jgi:hypothetical protein
MVAAFVCLYVRPAHSAFLENPPEDFWSLGAVGPNESKSKSQFVIVLIHSTPHTYTALHHDLLLYTVQEYDSLRFAS